MQLTGFKTRMYLVCAYLLAVDARDLPAPEKKLAIQNPESGYSKAVELLDLRGKNLTALPQHVYDRISLKTLFADTNVIEEIPKDIGKLINLQTVDLSYNRLTKLPEEVNKLSDLRTLILFNNRLETLTDEIVALTKLTVLDLSDNELKALPKDIGDMSSLKLLDLDNNMLQELPASIEKLEKTIDRISLRRNRMKMHGEPGKTLGVSELSKVFRGKVRFY